MVLIRTCFDSDQRKSDLYINLIIIKYYTKNNLRKGGKMKSQIKETTLLDSSLNTVLLSIEKLNKSYIKNYNIKVIDMQDYKQIYLFPKQKTYHEKLPKKEYILNDLDLFNNDSIIRKQFNSTDKPLFKNILRSKIKLQRLVKCNEKHFKTFITLTFKENITDLNKAYKIFRQFVIRTSKLQKDFKWVCVPEFQKSGRVHYHLITNIDLDNTDLIYKQQEQDKIYYHIKTWSKLIKNKKEYSLGFDCVELVKDKDGNDTKKLCGYISKYMSKSYIEDCFYNKNRYYSSQNLVQPYDILIDTTDINDSFKLENIFKNSDIIYTNTYKDYFDNDITFIEIKTTS